jgi:hypothetical protein
MFSKRKWVYLVLVIGFLTFQVLPAAGSLDQPSGQQDNYYPPDQSQSPQAYQLYLPYMIRPPGSSYNSTFGVETWSYGAYENGSTLLNQANLFWIRRNGLIWSDVEPNKGNRIWTASSVIDLEGDFKYAFENGRKIILVVRSTPTWAQVDGKACGRIQEDDIPAFADFMADVVKRYSVAPYHVKYFEIGNEPDAAADFLSGGETFGCWGEPSEAFYGGQYYAQVLKQVYPKMKAANSEVNVLIGGLLMDCDPLNPPAGKDCSMSNYLEGILAGGGGPYFDSVSFHAYDYYLGEYGEYSNSNWNSAYNTTGPTLLAKNQFLRTVLAKYGVTGKKIIATEIALVCQSQHVTCGDDKHQKTKAYYAVEAYAAAIADGIIGSIWFHQYNIWNETGLMGINDTPIYDVYYAVKFAGYKIGTSNGGKNVSQGAFIIYELNTSNGRIWIAWSKDNTNHDLTFSGSLPKAAYDTFGNPLAVASTMVIGVAPVYLEWGP